MAPYADGSPTDFVPPPSYQLSQEQFDRKTTHAIRLSSSIHQPIIDEDGWPIYDAATFDAVAKSYERSSPGSSSAGLPGADIPRHRLPPSTDPMKTRSSDRRRRNHNPDRDFPEEPREATPPPPFTATGPSLDGPPFDEVVTMSYHGPDTSTQIRRASLSPPLTQPIAPGRSHRFSDPQLQTQSQAPPNPYYSHRPASMQPDFPSRLIPASAITRVEFDPQMAYAPNGRNGNHTSIHGGASAFYNHAVASQLGASPTMSTSSSSQTGYSPDRESSPYSSGYSTGTTYRRYPDERYSTLPHGHRFSTPASLPSAPHMVSSTSFSSGSGYAQQPNGAVRGPLPPVPPVPYSQWAGSEAQLVQDVYGGNG